MSRMERKYLAHFIDASFGGQVQGLANPTYVRLGKDLESYSEELNPQVDVRRNILGEQNVIHNGYQVQSTAEPYYADEDDLLFAPIAAVANYRKTGEACQTTRVECLVDATGKQIWAYKEDCWVVPNNVGGDTSGVQIPFNVYNAGNRVPGQFNMASKAFTASSITLNKTSTSIAHGSNETLTATKVPASAAGYSVVWKSSDTSKATVDQAGKVTGVAAGSCVVTAEWFGAKASCSVTIT